MTIVGRRVRDLVADDEGTIVGRRGHRANSRYEVEWDRGTPHPSYISLREPYFELMRVRESGD